MATTTNFGWETPDDTDLVKDGALAIRTLGNSIDTSLVDLKGGTTGQVLSKTSNTDMDFTWVSSAGDIEGVTAGTGISGGGTSGTVTITNSMATAIDAKGDLIAGTGADTFARLAVGTNGQVLQADSTTATGLAWASASSAFVGCSVYRGSALSLDNNTALTINFEDESFDTDAFHSNTTNPSRITIPSGKGGKYTVIAQVKFAGGGSGLAQMIVRKNGATAIIYETDISSTENTLITSNILSLVAGDYLEVRAYQNSGASRNVEASATTTYFSVQYLGA